MDTSTQAVSPVESEVGSIVSALPSRRWWSRAATGVSASLSRSPVRMRTTCSSGCTKILPSPTLPVRAADTMVWMQGSTNGSEHGHLDAHLLVKLHDHALAAILLHHVALTTVPAHARKRHAGDADLTSARLTSGSCSGRMMAVMSFMGGGVRVAGTAAATPRAAGRTRRTAVSRGSLRGTGYIAE